MDQIVLHLQKVAIRSTNHPDDYVAKEELVLEGEGTTFTEDGNVPLPQNAYEIPLLGDIHSPRKRRIEGRNRSCSIYN